MFKKIDEYGNIIRTPYAPGTYFVEPNPRRKHIPDFKRVVVLPVVNGLKVKLPRVPDRQATFDIVDRPIGYQAMTPTPRKVSDIAPIAQVSQMLQSARIEKLLIDAPDKTATRFWSVYNTWTDGQRLRVLHEAIDTIGHVSLVPIEINSLTIAKWDWAVWYLSTMVTNRLIKKYQQTVFTLLKLFFTKAKAEDVANYTRGTATPTNIVTGWAFDEFTIVRTACEQLEVPSDPELYGFPPPYKVGPQEFKDKTSDILLYLTANSSQPMAEHIAMHQGTPLNFDEVKKLMAQSVYQVDMKTRIIEDYVAPVAPEPEAGEEAGGEEAPPPVRGTPVRPARGGPAASPDMYPWERQLEERMIANGEIPVYRDRQPMIGADPLRMPGGLFEVRKRPHIYAQHAGLDAVLYMRRKMMDVNDINTNQRKLNRIIINTLHGSTMLNPTDKFPLTTGAADAIIEADDQDVLDNWKQIILNRHDPEGVSVMDTLITALNRRDPGLGAEAAHAADVGGAENIPIEVDPGALAPFEGIVEGEEYDLGDVRMADVLPARRRPGAADLPQAQRRRLAHSQPPLGTPAGN